MGAFRERLRALRRTVDDNSGVTLFILFTFESECSEIRAVRPRKSPKNPLDSSC